MNTKFTKDIKFLSTILSAPYSKHCTTANKTETYLVKAKNSSIRDCLARFNHKKQKEIFKKSSNDAVISLFTGFHKNLRYIDYFWMMTKKMIIFALTIKKSWLIFCCCFGKNINLFTILCKIL